MLLIKIYKKKTGLKIVSVDLKESYTLFPETDTKINVKKSISMPESKDETAVAYWAKCLKIIQDNVDVQVYKTWFEPIKAHVWEPNKLTILVPSQWFYEWIETHYFTLLQKTIKRVMGEDAALQYEVVVEEVKDTLESRTIKVPALKYPTNIQSGNGHASAAPFNTYLNPRYVFDNFIVGDSNQLAFSAAVAVSQNPGGTRFNPLFIYGDTGLGKTHLAQAIGNNIINRNPRSKVLCSNSERFTNEFMNALQNHSTHDFAKSYREVDVLIIDDIQFLTGKPATQNHFFHTFNDLYQSGKQLIFVSDRAPREMADLDARLISRFQWGLIADIQPPDFETRMAIVKRKSEDEGIEIPFEIIEYLARHITDSVRDIEGALISLFAKVTFDRRPLSLEMAQEVVFGNGARATGPVTISDIKKVVSDYFSIDVALMESKSRKHEIALARQMAMFISKQLTELSLKNIGVAFSGRDHSTVLHSCQAIENYLITDKTIKNAYENILNRIRR